MRLTNKELQKLAGQFHKKHKASVEAVKSLVDLDNAQPVTLALVVDLYEPFDPNGHRYLKGDTFQYDGNIYKVIKEHTTEEGCKPDTGLESLYHIYNTDPYPE